MAGRSQPTRRALRLKVNASRYISYFTPFRSDGEGSAIAGTDVLFAATKGDDVRTFKDAKSMAKTLRQAIAARNVEISHSTALEIVARQFGYENWNILAARIDAENVRTGEAQEGVSMQAAIPIFRIFSVEKAMEFYRDFLGFNVDWEHRFGDNFPLYAQVSRSGFRLHLSEHAGDASPGARAFIHVTGIEELHAELTARNYRYMKPGLEDQPWGKELMVTDPFSNRITFCEQA